MNNLYIQKAFLKFRNNSQHFNNFTSQLVFRALTLIIFAYAVPTFINRLGEHTYGLLSLLLTLFAYLSVMDFGFGYALFYRITKVIAKSGSKENSIQLIKKTVLFFIGLSIFILFISYFFASSISMLLLNSELLKYEIRLVAFSLSLLLLDTMLISILRAFNKISVINFSNFVSDVLRSMGMVIVAIMNWKLYNLIQLFILAALIKFFLDICFVIKEYKSISWLIPKYSIRDIKINISIGGPLAIATVFGILINSMDRFYISRNFSLTDLSYYSLASDVNTKAYFLIGAFASSILTPMMRKVHNNALNSTLVKKMLVVPFFIFILYYIPLILFRNEIFRIWISDDFGKNISSILPIISISSFFYMLSAIYYIILQSYRMTNIILISYVISFVLLILSLLILPKVFGLGGVALSVVIVNISQFLVMHKFVWKKVKN